MRWLHGLAQHPFAAVELYPTGQVASITMYQVEEPEVREYLADMSAVVPRACWSRNRKTRSLAMLHVTAYYALYSVYSRHG